MNIKLNFYSGKRAVVLKVAAFLFAAITLGFSLSSCDEDTDTRIVIWTNSTDFAQYTELYNRSHNNDKVVVVYKENPAKSLPPAKNEAYPDIIIGPWIECESIYKNFKSLDYIFDRQILSSSIFYPQLMEAGKYSDSQYLLPVSFNLPAVIFDANENSRIEEKFILTLDNIKKYAAEFNEVKKSGSFAKMGLTLSCNSDFLYLITKLYDVNFRIDNDSTKYEIPAFTKAVKEIYEWVSATNKSFQTEKDFAFKYLNIPDYRQVASGKTLFTYATSDRILDILHEQESNIDFRWISSKDRIFIEDDALYLGIYKKTTNQASCTQFITWLFNADNQDKLLERKIGMNLDTEKFGIAGGFSSLVDVTEKILPKYYTKLLSNLPPSQMLVAPLNCNPRWDDYKSSVIEPFFMESLIDYEKTEKLKESESTDEPVLKAGISLDDFEKEWRKSLFD